MPGRAANYWSIRPSFVRFVVGPSDNWVRAIDQTAAEYGCQWGARWMPSTARP